MCKHGWLICIVHDLAIRGPHSTLSEVVLLRLIIPCFAHGANSIFWACTVEVHPHALDVSYRDGSMSKGHSNMQVNNLQLALEF